MIIGIKKIDDTKILIDREDELPDEVTLWNAMILILCVIKDHDKFYPQLFIKETLVTGGKLAKH